MDSTSIRAEQLSLTLLGQLPPSSGQNGQMVNVLPRGFWELKSSSLESPRLGKEQSSAHPSGSQEPFPGDGPTSAELCSRLHPGCLYLGPVCFTRVEGASRWAAV